MTTNDRINAILINPDFNILHRKGTLNETKRTYAFWFIKLTDAKKGSFEYKLAKCKLWRAGEELMNEHLAVITRTGIEARPNG